MAEDINEIVKKTLENVPQYKSIHVEKNLELEFDIGNLLATDNNPIDLLQYRKNSDNYLDDLARDNTQLLINKIWELKAERFEDAVVVKLPDPVTVIPREKRVPKAKPLTKWEEYKKAKGIQKRKRGNLVWDEVAKDWKPRWGYKRGDDPTRDWLIEYSHNDDPNTDLFAKKKEEKKERVAKNEYQRLRNIARANKVKIPSVGLMPTEMPSSKQQVDEAIVVAKRATASLGKFQEALPDEKPVKIRSKKRKFEPLFGNMQNEKKQNLSIIDSVLSKVPKLNIEKAVNKQISDLEKGRQQERLNAPRKKSKGGGSGRRRKDGKRRGAVGSKKAQRSTGARSKKGRRK